jgi:predicted short-subunit dehydrogenase-like oxidoreductase (DUF2520 family)
VHSFRIIGPGRAGLSLAGALRAAGDSVEVVGRGGAVSGAAAGVDALVLAVPDDAVSSVAAAVAPDPSCVVLHLAASLGLEVLAPHPRRASLHPLVPLPDPAVGAARLASGVPFAVAGDPLAEAVALRLGGRPFRVADEDRAAYHAAACTAANHLVALLGQVERVAAVAGLALDDFLPLAEAALDDVRRLGPAAALTGPAARGDWGTVGRHLAALPEGERPGYEALVRLALRLADADSLTVAAASR